MALEHLKQLSPEEMAQMRANAAVAKAEKAAFNKANEHKYKLSYMDQGYWEDLRTKYKIRFPTYNEPASAKGIRRYMRKLGIGNDTFKDHYTSVEYFMTNNPTWTLLGVCGLLLEMKEGT